MISIFSQLFRKQQPRDFSSTDNRVVIVHNHLFKNAGSSIDWTLKQNFGDGFIDHRDDSKMREGAKYLGPYLTKNTFINAISSHHLTLPLPTLKDVKLLQLMMFRHPIERVTSVYNYERKQKNSTTPGATHARKLDLKDYILWRMETGVGPTIRNFHVVSSIPNRKKGKLVIGGEIELAMQEVVNIPLLGLVEMFDESMVLFEETLREYFPTINLSYKMQNINQDRNIPLHQRIEALENEIGKEVFDLLMEKNREDMILYDFAVDELKKRREVTPDFLMKLRDFNERCSTFR